MRDQKKDLAAKNPYNFALSTIQQSSDEPVLVLRGLGLSRLPPEIGQLRNLKLLDLSDNLLTDLPPEVGQLPNLRILVARSNKFSSVPLAIQRLRQLLLLDLSDNQLSALPRWLTLLSRLQVLGLHGNPALKLSPSILGNSQGEMNIVARHSAIPDFVENLGAPPWNPVGATTPRVLGKDSADFTKDLRFMVTGHHVAAKSILDFYFSRLSGKTRPLNEVKLILVGRGGAGKTSTVNALRDLPFREEEASTPGIALCDWTMPQGRKQPVTAHIWDFAGQVITHALHQFFFSVRSVYVLVLTGRENNERDDAEYWLRLIRAFGTDDHGQGPPVLIVLNKWDVPGCRPRVDRGALCERYPFIRGFVEMDCKSKKGVSKLRAALSREVERLAWVRDPFPEAWDEVRRALSKRGARRAHLTYAEYRALCVKHGVADAGEQDSLAEILHNLGAALNYRNDPRLREATVLQPEWLTKNVYSLVRRAEKNAGALKQLDIETALRSVKHQPMREYLTQLMVRFEIAYTPRTSAGGLWLVPQALPDVQPAGAKQFRDVTEATRLRYSYQALPEGLVARAIVRLHEFVAEVRSKKQQWASGAILRRGDARALIRTEPQDRQVMITVTGPAKARQQLAGLCQAEMREIHTEIPGLDPLEETQVQGEWVATATLELDEREGRKTGIPTRDRGTVSVDPTEPNNAYSEKTSRSDDVWKPTVFISYSKTNLNQRKRLESELKVLKNEGLLASHWQDRMIAPGDEWDGAIQRELETADVVVILASTATLSTDYITEHEIPKALELHDAGTTVVVPLILEACRWDQTPLGKLNALPEKAKPLNKWRPASDGWSSVSDGLATVFKSLAEKQAKHRVPKRTKKVLPPIAARTATQPPPSRS
jgi:internalin A